MTAKRLRSEFELEVFDRRRAGSDELLDYLEIYIQHLTPQHRTKTRELLQFLREPLPNQSIIYFGLLRRGVPCGIATLMLYRDSHIAFVDHMAIAQTDRGAGAFFEFCNRIADYLERKRIVFNYLLVEIILDDQPITTGIDALSLIRLTRFLGFKIACLPYFAPDESLPVNREGCKAALAVYAQPERSEINALEFLRIAHVIFFDHYLAWHRKTMTQWEFKAYEDAAREEFARLEDVVQRKGTVRLNGMKNFDLPYILEAQRPKRMNLMGSMVLVAVPATITIVFAILQSLWLTVVSIGVTGLFFSLLLIPSLRRPLLKFFQLEE